GLAQGHVEPSLHEEEVSCPGARQAAGFAFRFGSRVGEAPVFDGVLERRVSVGLWVRGVVAHPGLHPEALPPPTVLEPLSTTEALAESVGEPAPLDERDGRF